MLNRLLLAAAAIVIVVLAGLAWHSHNQKSTGTCTVQTDTTMPPQGQKYTKFNITIKADKIVGVPNEYLVNPGTGLEFHVNSDKCGKVSVLADPAQTITFTKRPLVFYFNAPRKAGTYLMTYEANGSKKVIRIGAVVVRSVKQ